MYYYVGTEKFGWPDVATRKFWLYDVSHFILSLFWSVGSAGQHREYKKETIIPDGGFEHGPISP